MTPVELAGYSLKSITADDGEDLRALQALLESDAPTWAALEGAPPRPDEAMYLATEVPPGVTRDRKHVWLWDGGVIEFVEGFPDAMTWYLGLIFLAPHARSAGTGSKLLRALADHVRARGGSALRLAVVADNAGARRLYDRLGFTHVARKQRPCWTGEVHAVDVLELRL